MKNRKLLIVICSICLVLIFAVLPLMAACAGAPDEVRLKFILGSSTATTFVWGNTWASLMEKYSPNIRLEVIPSKGFVEASRFLLAGEANMAASYEAMIKMTREGSGPYEDIGTNDSVRLITTCMANPGYAVVLDKSPIKAFTYEEVKGKKIIGRQPGSFSAIWHDGMLQVIGIDSQKDITMMYGGITDMITAVRDGSADIFMGTLGTPNAAVEELFLAMGCRFLTMSEDVIKKANEDIGGWRDELPAGLYHGMDSPVPVQYLMSYFITTKELDDDVAYELVKIWWDNAAERDVVHASLPRDGTAEMFKKGISGSKTPVHPGALKYYKEKGWLP
ncbi:TAXI family TRAP transporter solute-binding subunit [Chloroflexota bacterium]